MTFARSLMTLFKNTEARGSHLSNLSNSRLSHQGHISAFGSQHVFHPEPNDIGFEFLTSLRFSVWRERVERLIRLLARNQPHGAVDQQKYL